MEQNTKVLSILEKMSAELVKLSTEQARTSQRLGNLEEGQVRVSAELGRVDNRLDSMDQRLNRVEEGQTSLVFQQDQMNEKLQFIIDTVVKIEIEHGQKLAALFDAFSLSEDRDQAQKASIAQLEQRVDRLEAIRIV